jgi:response regulator RpfG family c-di-GMP phosphodiesterase
MRLSFLETLMPKIVLAGQDIHLLETRAEVLKKIGSDVVCCVGPSALDVVESETPDLLVLCHTIAHEEAEAIAERVYACCPKTRVLLVVSQVIADRPSRNAKFDATSMPDPAQLVARCTELLHGIAHYRVRELPYAGQEPAAR